MALNPMDKLMSQINKVQQRGVNSGDGKVYYYPKRDAAGNGSAVLRFLPGKTDNDDFFVKVYSHGFEGPTGKWFIEECPTTIGETCYCCEQNTLLWKTELQENKDIVSGKEGKDGRKRRENYIANVLVLEDDQNRENVGKVFLFKFGFKIFEKICEASKPTFKGINPINPFDLDTGANFQLRIRKVKGQTNYDLCAFDQPSKVTVDSAEFEKMEALSQFLDKARFKSPEELQKKFDAVVGNTVRLATSRETVQERVTKPSSQAPSQSIQSTPEQTKTGVVEEQDDILKMMAELTGDDVPQ